MSAGITKRTHFSGDKSPESARTCQTNPLSSVKTTPNRPKLRNEPTFTRRGASENYETNPLSRDAARREITKRTHFHAPRGSGGGRVSGGCLPPRGAVRVGSPTGSSPGWISPDPGCRARLAGPARKANPMPAPLRSRADRVRSTVCRHRSRPAARSFLVRFARVRRGERRIWPS